MKKSIQGEPRYSDAPHHIAEEIESSVRIPDDFPTPEELGRELKKTVTIRLDPDIYAWFRLPGTGYQTRINAVLRAYMDSMRRADSQTAASVGAGSRTSENRLSVKDSAPRYTSAKKTKKAAAQTSSAKARKLRK